MVTVTKFVIITKLVIFTVQTHLGNKKNLTIKFSEDDSGMSIRLI